MEEDICLRNSSHINMKLKALFFLLGFICHCSIVIADNDTSSIKNVEIMSFYFNREARFSFTEATMLKLRNSDTSNKHSFYKLLERKESVNLSREISPLLTVDTISAISDNNVDLRFLLVVNYEGNKPPLYIGVESDGTMFINGKRCRRDKMILLYSLEYITNKGIKRSIEKSIKSWE